MMKLVRLACLGIVLACLLGIWGLGQLQQVSPPPRPQEVTVCPEGPPKCDFSSIQRAVYEVAYGGTINILPGEYIENIRIVRPLTLRGVEEARLTISKAIIRPEDPEKATVRIVSSNVTLEGLWINDGKKGIEVGGLQEEEAKLLHEVCTEVVIKGNTIFGAKMGISVSAGSQADIQGNALIDNSVGIWVESSPKKTLIKENTIKGGIGIGITGGIAEVVNNLVDTVALGTGISILEAPGFLPPSVIVEGNIVLGGSGIIATGVELGAIVTGELRLYKNRIIDSHSVGIGIQVRKAELKGNLIIGTSSGVSGGGDGVIAIASEALELADNIVVSNKENGIMAGLIGSGKLRLESNVILRNWGYGFSFINICAGPEGEGWPELPEPGEQLSVELVGSNNIIAENEAGDLCPADYPWPAGFKRP